MYHLKAQMRVIIDTLTIELDDDQARALAAAYDALRTINDGPETDVLQPVEDLVGQIAHFYDRQQIHDFAASYQQIASLHDDRLHPVAEAGEAPALAAAPFPPEMSVLDTAVSRASQVILDLCGPSPSPTRRQGQGSHNLTMRRDLLESADWMLQKYVDEQMSTAAMGKLIGCSGPTVADALRRHGIQIRAWHGGKGRPTETQAE